jgi:hypothetical protein
MILSKYFFYKNIDISHKNNKRKIFRMRQFISQNLNQIERTYSGKYTERI